jgi:hypothetical protein
LKGENELKINSINNNIIYFLKKEHLIKRYNWRIFRMSTKTKQLIDQLLWKKSDLNATTQN